ncbi:Huntingtin [Bagarius yarrelli]|uniref:Huntingtin n=1 Tax=Bagarius yarrelli TaxID=175774 RepID=A0A556TMF3_BAGYA|nr:Huntingtin [Bagarius yarrelli]
MATMEKLMKAFESLKSFQQQQHGPLSAEELVQKQKKDLATTKKDRVTHCLTICENIVAQSLRTSPEFQKLLGIAMEMFLLCSDDKESDVRMVADECLNKIIKALMDSNLPRLQLELYKEIKKNGASRSLRAALWRFAELAHFVRPQKCRPYLVNLLPCLTRITKRQEETVQETLASSIPKIMAALGNFANDTEIKSSSPTIRRTAASSAVSVCLVVPVDEDHSSHLILGVLLTLRYLMPLLQQHDASTSLKGSFGVMRKEADVSPTPKQLIQVYELTLHYTQHRDHNVVTASLELLQQLFRTPSPELLNTLIVPGKITYTQVFREEMECRARSGSIVELIGKILSGEEEGLEDDPEKAEVPTGSFTASVGTESSGDAPSSSGVGSLSQADIITEQPRSSQHALQPGDSVDLSASSEQGGGPDTPDDEDEDMLSRSSSSAARALGTATDLHSETTPSSAGAGSSSPPSDSSQTTTEGPDSAVTPSDCAELVRYTSFHSDSEASSSYTASTSTSSSISSSSSSSSSSSAVSFASSSDKVLDGSESQYSGMQIGTLQDEEEEGAAPASDEAPESFAHSVLALSKPHLLEGKGHNRQASDGSVDRFIPKDEVLEPVDLDNKMSRIKGDIGHYTDPTEAPLVHCVRLLSASFLLTGQRNGLVPDKEVRVSVKALAVGCVGAAAALLPETFFSRLYLEPLDGQQTDELQYISDVLLYIEHGDPQIRGATAILCGALIQAILFKTRFSTESWLARLQSTTGNKVSLEDIVPLLQRSLKDESSVTCKMGCSAVRHCIMALCSSSFSELGLQLLIDLLTLRDCSYWLVRNELLETLAEVDFR